MQLSEGRVRGGRNNVLVREERETTQDFGGTCIHQLYKCAPREADNRMNLLRDTSSQNYFQEVLPSSV